MGSILQTGISALNTFQRQLTTTGHNIANVNTEGYSRQRVDMGTREAQQLGTNFIGNGVHATGIRRSYDQYLAGRVRAYNSAQQEYEVYHNRASQIDNVIADAAAGLDSMMQDFFASVQDVSADPSSIPARNVMLNRSELLADRFRSLNNWVEDLRTQVNRDFDTYVTEINNLGSAIASVNTRLQGLSIASGSQPNDLLDERDDLIDQLSSYVKVQTLEQDDGSLNVVVGTGQALVVGSTVNKLVVTNNPEAADHKEVSINMAGGGTAPITKQINGGKLGGLLRFRSEVLDPTQNSMGLVAIGLADKFNEEHVTGMDLDGDLGLDYFKIAEPEVLGNPNNGGTVTATFDDVTNLTNHEYELSFDGTWSLIDLSDDTAVTLTGSGTAADPFIADGMALEVGGAVAGDTYRLRPTRLGAYTIDTLLTDTRDIAAAEAVNTSAAATNTGTGDIGSGAQVSSDGTTKLAAPITLTFDSGANAFNLSSGGTLAYDPVADSGSTLTLNIAGLGDFNFTMNGTPANGDIFTLADNTGGRGDNRNALRLADLQNQQLLFGDTASLSDAYGFLVADVGTQTHQAGENAEVQERLLTQSDSAKSAVSGVNLDEEAADLVRFQQAYTAAAQVISTANTLFDTLLGAVRR